MTLKKLYKIIQDRKQRMPTDSYVTSLFRSGEDRIIQKVGEEVIEVIIAAKNKNRKLVISEIADLFFHLLVMLVYLNITTEEIFDELSKRKRVQNNPIV